jgi:sulfite exporter TauE/SafE
VYTVLMTAASTGNAGAGAVTMFAFGLGTAPAMLGLTVAAPALGTFLGDRLVRRIVGFSLVVLAFWMLMPLLASGAGSGHMHH